MTNEQLIITACQRGDFSDFGELYDAYIKKIYDFVYYKTHHQETAEDLTSITWTKVIERIGKYDPGKGTFQSWLYRIAQNTVIDHYRTKKHESSIDDAWDIASSDDIERDAHARAALEKVQAHLCQLTSIQRDILVMRLWQSMSYREIAEIVGKSEANAKMIASRALSQLRTTMPLDVFVLLLCMQIIINSRP